MPESVLRLASHELAPNRRAQWDGEPFVFRANWHGRERDFIGQVVSQIYSRMIFFALADEPERGNFVSAPIWISKGGIRLEQKCEPRTQFTTDDLPQLLSATAEEGWGRFYFLDNDLNLAENEAVSLRLFLASSGWGQWSAAPDFYQKVACFQWHNSPDEAREFALFSSLELLNRWREKLLDPQSDAAKARELTYLSKTQLQQNCRPVTRSCYEQWQQVLSWYLQVHFPSETTQKGRLKYHIHNAHPDLIFDIWTGQAERRQLSPNLALFCEWTLRHFAPELDADYVNSCFAAQEWANRSFALTIHAQKPTQHERIEAWLQLRDWLADKAAPSEIDALLRAD